MFTTENPLKIPFAIECKIRDVLHEREKTRTCNTFTYGFFDYLDYDLNGKIVVVTVGYKTNKRLVKNPIKLKQCMFRYVEKSMEWGSCDLIYTTMGGYKPIFNTKKHYGYTVYQPTEKWDISDTEEDLRLYPKHITLINPEFLNGTEFKYAPIDTKECTIESLRFYKKYPQIEMLYKAGLKEMSGKEYIIKKCIKDKNFLNFVRLNIKQIVSDLIAPKIVRYAYNHNISVLEAMVRETLNREIREGMFDFEIDMAKLRQYLKRISLQDEQISRGVVSNYKDYIRACKILELDLTDTKNLFPLEFQVWHDIRINQMKTKIAEKTADMLKELNGKMIATRNVYKNLEICESEDLKVFIAKNKMELIREGDALVHCVGRMDYDQRQAQGKSLICFIRKTNDINTPYVTLELALKDNVRVVQCYGKKDTRPCEDVRKFVYEEFEPFAKRVVAKVRAKEKKANKEAVAV